MIQISRSLCFAHTATLATIATLVLVTAGHSQNSIGYMPSQIHPPTLTPPTLTPPTLRPSTSADQTATPNAMPATESLELFNPRDVQLSWQNRHWLLIHQNHILKDFGTRHEEARQALRLIQDLGLNQRGQIGSPTPSLEYWLTDGRAPTAMPLVGIHTLPLDPNRLRVDQVQGQWCIRDDNRYFFNFIDRADEARAALAILKKYQFHTVGYIGQSAPSMMIFLGHAGDSPNLKSTHGIGTSARGMESPHFSRVAKGADGKPRFEQSNSGRTQEAVVRPLIPPLTAPLTARAAGSGTLPTLDSQRGIAWRGQPQFHNQSKAPPTHSDRRTFDWRQVQVRQQNGAWQLSTGHQVLADFGPSFNQAQTAVAAVRHYRFSEQLPTGTGTGSYMLAQGGSAKGVMLGLYAEAFQPEKLEVQQQPTGYALCEGDRVILQMGDQIQSAQTALQSIRTYKIDRICRLGDPLRDGLTLLIRSK